MISMRGIAMSLAIHGVAAALISASAAIQPEAPVEDVAAIPVELSLKWNRLPSRPPLRLKRLPKRPLLKHL